MTSEQRREYVKEVCLALYGKEPEETRMSNAEVTEIGDWARRGVPLAHVLQAIQEMRGPNFIRAKAGWRAARYVKPAVEAEHERASRRM